MPNLRTLAIIHGASASSSSSRVIDTASERAPISLFQSALYSSNAMSSRLPDVVTSRNRTVTPDDRNAALRSAFSGSLRSIATSHVQARSVWAAIDGMVTALVTASLRAFDSMSHAGP